MSVFTEMLLAESPQKLQLGWGGWLTMKSFTISTQGEVLRWGQLRFSGQRYPRGPSLLAPLRTTVSCRAGRPPSIQGAHPGGTLPNRRRARSHSSSNRFLAERPSTPSPHLIGQNWVTCPPEANHSAGHGITKTWREVNTPPSGQRRWDRRRSVESVITLV